jgi:hypothetical protein
MSRTATADLDARLQRVERVLTLLASERFGISGLGPMDPAWVQARERARRDLAQIVAEQAEPQFETRVAS